MIIDAGTARISRSQEVAESTAAKIGVSQLRSESVQIILEHVANLPPGNTHTLDDRSRRKRV